MDLSSIMIRFGWWLNTNQWGNKINMKVMYLLALNLLSLLFQCCSNSANTADKCEEKDIVCRSKYYMSLIKERKFKELKDNAALPDVINTPANDTLLVHFSNFLFTNDSLPFEYRIKGNRYADVIEVNVFIRDTSYQQKRPIICFDFAQNAVSGLPFLNWILGGVPHKKYYPTVEEIKKAQQEADSLNYYSPR